MTHACGLVCNNLCLFLIDIFFRPKMADGIGPNSDLHIRETNGPDKKIIDSGWDRVKHLYNTSGSDLYGNVAQAVGMGSITGFLIGGRMGGRVSGKEHILGNQLTVYPSKMQAHREYHSAVIKGFVKNGSRWGWRMGLFAGIYSAILTVMQEYRDQEDAINFVTAGAVTGATYKMFSGLRGIVVGTILGTGFSLPLALVVQGFMFLVPSDIKEKYREIKLESRKQQEIVEEWQQNVHKFDNLITKWESELDSEPNQEINSSE